MSFSSQDADTRLLLVLLSETPDANRGVIRSRRDEHGVGGGGREIVDFLVWLSAFQIAGRRIMVLTPPCPTRVCRDVSMARCIHYYRMTYSHERPLEDIVDLHLCVPACHAKIWHLCLGISCPCTAAVGRIFLESNQHSRVAGGFF